MKRRAAAYDEAAPGLWEGPNPGEVWSWDPTEGQQPPGGLAANPLHSGCDREGRQLHSLFIH
jgi:hypothetical protein